GVWAGARGSGGAAARAVWRRPAAARAAKSPPPPVLFCAAACNGTNASVTIHPRPDVGEGAGPLRLRSKRAFLLDLRQTAGREATACARQAVSSEQGLQLLACPFALGVAAAGRGVEGLRLLRLRRCAPTLSTN